MQKETQRARLQELLAGPLAAKYGCLPIVPLPGDDELALGFAKHLLEILKAQGIYRRASVIVRPDGERTCLEVVRPQSFSTWVEHHVLCYRRKFDRNGEPYQVLHTMNNEQAEKVLACEDFWKGLPEIEAVNAGRSLAIDEETGEMRLLPGGYDENTRTFTFE